MTPPILLLSIALLQINRESTRPLFFFLLLFYLNRSLSNSSQVMHAYCWSMYILWLEYYFDKDQILLVVIYFIISLPFFSYRQAFLPYIIFICLETEVSLKFLLHDINDTSFMLDNLQNIFSKSVVLMLSNL